MPDEERPTLGAILLSLLFMGAWFVACYHAMLAVCGRQPCG